jgi:hypothetical protein
MADSLFSQHMIAVEMAAINNNHHKRGTTFLANPPNRNQQYQSLTAKCTP